MGTEEYLLVASAFHVGEWGEMLPQSLRFQGIDYQLFLSIGLDRQWFVVYANEKDYHDNAPFPIKMCHSEAEARGKMVLYLKENKLI